MPPVMRFVATLVAFCAVIAGCVTSSVAPGRIVLSDESTEAQGWLHYTGEWALFPDRSPRNYDPFSSDESQHCVSLAVEELQLNTQLRRYHRRNIRVRGRVVSWSELPLGSSEAERLMNRRYYKGEPVFDTCLRQRIFVVREIIPAPSD